MPRYVVTVDARVELVYELEAPDAEAARHTVNTSFGVSARLFDMEESQYEVLEDMITDLHSMTVQEC